MFATTRPIADPIELIARLPVNDPVAWVHDGEGLIGWGVAARLEVRGNERFSRTQRWWSTLCASLEIDDTVSMPGTGPVAFGSFSFDSESGSSYVVVPRVVVGRRAGQAWITTIGREPRPRAILPPVSVPDRPISVTWAEGSASAIEWQGAVAEAVRRIKAGELDKVVLARDVIAHVDGPLDVRHLLLRLAAAYPSCWTFAVGDLIGATPELLVRRTGDLVTSRVLAGTVRRRGDDQADAGLARALLASGKDAEEHEYAVHSVARALAAHCTDLDVPARPHVLELANVQHLATDVTGRLADAAPVLALAASLHPTAAVCGTPTERAFSVIREIEGMDRGRYAGPVGWFDRHGDGEFGIALRCAAVDVEAGQVRSFAGCGIVAGSDPGDELAESVAKLVPIRDALELR
ncbi:MAG: isochorismate synthase [Actinobacteria bacterium]|jgi:menaquinone-specific isochorismate synthase|nr:isochorismate synthase [Actinomycetota bacterium]